MQLLDFLDGPLELGCLDDLPRAVAPCGCQLVRARSIQHFIGAARLQREKLHNMISRSLVMRASSSFSNAVNCRGSSL